MSASGAKIDLTDALFVTTSNKHTALFDHELLFPSSEAEQAAPGLREE
jgi:hypothetical protein